MSQLEYHGRAVGFPSGGSRPPSEVVFALSGEYWTVGHPGATFSVRASKGLTYLHRLLQHPGKEFHALDLTSGPEIATEVEDAHKDEASHNIALSVGRLGDSGEMLDAQAKREYRSKLAELREELEKLRRVGDEVGAAEVESELDFLMREIKRAVGLGNRDRRSGSAAERARLNVTRAIKSALEKIAESDPQLAGVLTTSIRTGTFCRYNADHDPAIRWRFSAGEPEAHTQLPPPREAVSFYQGFRWVLDGTPFVGRASERALLLRNLERARAGTGRIVTIGGEAGVGKTRLSREFCEVASAAGFLAMAGACYDADDAVPFVPFVEILESAHAQSSSQEAFRNALGPNAAELVRLMPQLRTIFPEIGLPQETNAQQSRRLLFSSVVELVSRVSASTPLLLLVEDLQWADEGSLALLAHLANAVANLPVMIVANYRNSEGDAKGFLTQGLYEISRLPNANDLKLPGLPTSEVAAMLRALSGKTPPPALVSDIYAATEGNPLFVRELYEHLAEGGKLFGQDGNFLRGLKIDETEVPRGIKLLLTRRLSKLDAATRKTLAYAAIIGKSFAFDLLEASVEADPEVLLDHLEKGEQVGLLHSTLDGGVARFHFSHELVRQAILGDVLAPRQQRIHLAVADAIEKFHRGTLDDRAVELAYHLSAAGSLADAQRTIGHLVTATRREMVQSASTNALRHISLALKMFSALPEGQRMVQQELWLQLLYGNASSAAKGWAAPEAGKAFEHAQKLCAKMGDTPQLFPVIAGLCAFHFVRGEFNSALSLAQRAAQMAELLDDDTSRIGAHWLQACSLFFLGDFFKAREQLESGISLNNGHQAGPERFAFGQDSATACLVYAGAVAWCLGQPNWASRQQEAIEMATRLTHPFTIAWELANRAVACTIRREWTQLSKIADEGMEVADRHGFDLIAVSCDFFRGVVLSQERPIEGIEHMRRTITEYRRMGSEMLVPWNHTIIAEALNRAGRLHEAHATLDEAFAVMNRTQERHYEAETHRVRAETYLLQSAGEAVLAARVPFVRKAQESLEEALKIASGQGAVAYELRAAIPLARLWIAEGRHGDARRTLEETCSRAGEGWSSPELEEAQKILGYSA